MDEQVGGQERGAVPVRDLTSEQKVVYGQRLAEVLQKGDGGVMRVGGNYMKVVDGQSKRVERVFDPEKDPKNPEVCSRAESGFKMVSNAVDRARGKLGKLEDGWQRDLAPTVKAGHDDLVVDGVSREFQF